MVTRTIDVSSNGAVIPLNVVVEAATGADTGAIAPARSLQVAGSLVSSSNPIPVSVTFPTTQAVSIASLPLATGAATSARQAAPGVAGTASNEVLTIQGIVNMTPLKTDGSAVTQPVSLATLPALSTGSNVIGSIANTGFAATQSGTWNLANITGTISLPTGAATSAKQPSLGVAGTPSADVLTVQGSAGMTALKVDASATTQPISGSVSISNFPATQPVSLASLPSLPTGSNAIGSVAVSNFPATQPISATTLPLPTGAATSAKQASFGTPGSASAEVLTVQGVNSMTPLKVDGSAVTQPVSLTTLPALATGSNTIGSIANTSFAATQSGTWNLTNISGTISLPTGAATSAKQAAPGTAGTPSTEVISVQGVTSGTPLNVSQGSNAATTTTSFSASATSGTFAISNRLAMIFVPPISGAPTLTLETSLDGGTNWAQSSIVLATSATVSKIIEADSLAKVSGAFGLSNAFRFTSTASITSTLSVRSVVQ